MNINLGMEMEMEFSSYVIHIIPPPLPLFFFLCNKRTNSLSPRVQNFYFFYQKILNWCHIVDYDVEVSTWSVVSDLVGPDVLKFLLYFQGFYNGDLLKCEDSYDKRGRTAQVCYIKMWELVDITVVFKISSFSELILQFIDSTSFVHVSSSRMYSYVQLMILLLLFFCWQHLR